MYVPVEISATAMLTDGSQAVLQGARGAGDQQEAVRRISGLSGEVFFRLDVPPDATHITLHVSEATHYMYFFCIQTLREKYAVLTHI